METKENDLAGPGRPAGRKWIFWTFPRSECGSWQAEWALAQLPTAF